MSYITTCPNCNKYLYSAADKNLLICPYCKKDMGEDENRENDTKEQVKLSLIIYCPKIKKTFPA